MRSLWLLLLLGCLLLVSHAAWATVAEVGTSSACDSGTDAVTGLNCSIDSGSGANRLMIIGLAIRTNLTVSPSCTYGGENATLHVSHSGAQTGVAAILYVVPTVSGSNTLACTWAPDTEFSAMGAITYQATNGFDGPFRNAGECGEGSLSTMTRTVTTVSGDVVVGVLTKRDSANLPFVVGPAAQEWLATGSNATTTNNVSSLGGSIVATGTSTSITFDWTDTVVVHGCAVPLQEAAAPAGVRRSTIIIY